MQNSKIPKDMLNIIFVLSDIKTKCAIKRLCHLTNDTYIIKRNNPYKCGVISCTLTYKKKKEYTLKLKNNSIKAKRQKIMDAYNHLIKTYELNKSDTIEFSIKWNNKIVKYIMKEGKILNNDRYENYDNGKKRSFCVIYDGTRYGTFFGKSSLQASKKAFSSLILKYKICNSTEFAMQELTYGSNHRFYFYRGTTKLLQNPYVVNLHNGIQIVHRRSNTVKCIGPNENLIYKCYIV